MKFEVEERPADHQADSRSWDDRQSRNIHEGVQTGPAGAFFGGCPIEGVAVKLEDLEKTVLGVPVARV